MGIFSFIAGFFSGKSKIEAERAETSRRLQDFLQNQIDTLGKDGHRVHFNEITVGYISHLVMMITKRPVSVSIVHDALVRIFTDETSLAMIHNAMYAFHTDVETQVKLAALFPIAKMEYEAGSGEFLIRHTNKARKSIDAMFVPGAGEAFDPSKVPPWTAKDLA